MIPIDPNKRYTPVTNLPVGQELAVEAIGVQRKKEISDGLARSKDRIIGASLLTGVPIEDLEEQSNEVVAEEGKATVGSPLQASIDNRGDLITVQEAALREQDLVSNPDLVYDQALLANSNEPALSVRLQTNQKIASDMLQDRFKDTLEQGWAGIVGDFIDYEILRYSPFALFKGIREDVTLEQETQSELIFSKMLELPPAEFQEWYADHLEDQAAKGVLTEENYFAVLDEMNNAASLGYMPEAYVDRWLSAAESAIVVGAALKGASHLSKLSKAKGELAAAEAVENIEDTALATERSVQDSVMPRYSDTTNGPNDPLPLAGAVSLTKQTRQLLGRIQWMNDQGMLGRMASKEEIQAAADIVKDEIVKTSSRPAFTTPRIIDTGLGRYAVQIEFGKPDVGEAFTDANSAYKFKNRLNDKGLSAEVIPKEDGTFTVGVQQKLDLTTAAGPADVSKPLKVLIQKDIAGALGSSAVNDLEYLNTQALMAEQAVGEIRKLTQPMFKNLEKLPATSKETMGAVWKRLRDGEDASRTANYTEEEFKVVWKQLHPDGKEPTAKDIEAYHSLVTLNDTVYFINATKVTDKFVRQGYKTIKWADKSIPAVRRPVADLPEGVKVTNVRTGQVLRKGDLREEDVVWRVARTDEDDVSEYVMSPSQVREVQPTDVLPYNPGGPRGNEGANYFITFGNRAILSAFSETEAVAARAQINEIVAAIKDVTKSTGIKFEDMTNELDDVIRRNNDWNPGIENTADLVRLNGKKKWNLDEGSPVSLRKRDEEIEDVELDSPYSGMTVGQYQSVTRRRADDVLMAYGGAETFNYNPIKTITDAMSSAAFEAAYSKYTYRAKTAWVKAAMRRSDIPKNANVNTLFNDIKPSGIHAKRLEELRSIIRRREFHKGPVSQAIEDMTQRTAEWVFDKTGLKMKPGDPVTGLLHLGFQSAFGFFNVGQFVLQSSWALSMPVISPRAGGRALGLAIPYRAALQMPDKAAKRLHKAFGVSEKEMREMMEYTMTSGRFDPGLDAAEHAVAPSFGISAWEGQSMLPKVVRRGMYESTKLGKRALDAGTVFFRKGENSARLVGQITAMLEYKQANKGASLLTEEARRWITKREHDLTLNMTTASRAAFQDGVLRLPTQWLSHSLRVMESLFTDRILTKGERIRLGTWMAVSGGLTGMGAHWAADEIGETLGFEPTGQTYNTMKYGVVDGILTWALDGVSEKDIRTAFGTRMSPIKQLLDTVQRTGEKTFLGTVMGPSGDIVGTGLVNMLSATNNLLNGHTSLAALDASRIYRAIGGLDNLNKARAIMQWGVYTSRSGKLMPFTELSAAEAFMAATGITNAKQVDYYLRQGLSFRESREVKSFVTKMRKEYQIAIQQGYENPELYTKLTNDIADKVELSGFNQYDKQRIRDQVFRLEENNSLWMLILNHVRRGQDYGAQVVKGYSSYGDS